MDVYCSVTVISHSQADTLISLMLSLSLSLSIYLALSRTLPHSLSLTFSHSLSFSLSLSLILSPPSLSPSQSSLPLLLFAPEAEDSKCLSMATLLLYLIPCVDRIDMWH